MKRICTPGVTVVITAFQKRIRQYALIFLTALPLFSAAQQGNNNNFIPELVFQNPALVSGKDKKEGAVYRFKNVANGIDALLEIKKISDNSTIINNIDLSQQGWNKAFQPEIGRSGNVSPFQNWWVLFHMSFVETGTNQKATLSKFYVTALDVDGDNVSIQEYIQMQKADSIKLSTLSYLSLLAPINCGLSNTALDKLTQGPVQNFTNIDTAAAGVMATYTYLNTSDLDFAIGGKSGARSSNAGLRLNSLWFKSFSMIAASQSTLPLQLLNFQGNANNSKASLQWTVAENETGNSFELEKSFDGTHFNIAAVIFTTAKSGVENYAYKESIDRTSFYRLKMINKDNSVSYSKIIRLSPEEKATNTLTILQNPVGSSLQFSYNTSSNENAIVNIYTDSGIKLFTTPLQSQKGNNTYSLNLDRGMKPGLYIFEIVKNKERSISKFLKQ